MQVKPQQHRSSALKLTIAALVTAPIAWSLAPAQDPFAPGPKAPAAAADEKGKAKADEPDLSQPRPLILQYLEEHKPTTPEGLAKAAEITLNIGRPDESRKYLAQLIDAKPDDAALAAVGRKLGPTFFLRIQREKDVQPEGGQAAALVFQALDHTARDPARIALLIEDLGSDDPATRARARNDLAEGRTDAAVALIEALADSAKVNLHRQIQIALLSMRQESEGPLVAALDSGDETLLPRVIETLGAMGSPAALPRLVRLSVDAAAAPAVRSAAAAALLKARGTTPKPGEAERFLERELELQLEHAKVIQPELGESVAIWQWSATENRPVARNMPPGDAALLKARAIAAELTRLAPRNENYRRLNLITALEVDKLLTGLDRPLPKGELTAAALAASEGADAVSRALADAIERDRVVAAVAAAEVLGNLREPRVLVTGSAEETPLALALRHSDRRLRVTAALAIAKIAPRESFAGASRVPETLAHFAGTAGGRRVLIAHPRGEPGQTLVGYVNRMNYEGEVAATGRAVQQKIVENADYEFLLVSDTLDAPSMKELLQWLRRDYRTARLPVGVMAQGENVDALRQALIDDRLTYVFPAISDLETAAELVRRLERIAGRNLIGRDERLDLAAASLDAFSDLAAQPSPAPNYDFLRQEDELIRALSVPGLSAKASRALSFLGTPRIQTALVEFVSQEARSIEARQAVAAAFADAVRRRGMLLTQDQVLLQYDRYNASETADAGTQAVLGSILDAIESRTLAAAGQP